LLTVHENTRWMSFYRNCNNTKTNLKYMLYYELKKVTFSFIVHINT
jgi:hypothetical protein